PSPIPTWRSWTSTAPPGPGRSTSGPGWKPSDMGSDEAQALMAEVNAAFAANDIAGARPHLERLAELLPGNGQVWRSLGQSCLAAEDMAAAERAFRAAVGIDGDDARAIDGLGIVHHRTGDLEEAETLHRRAIAIDP